MRSADPAPSRAGDPDPRLLAEILGTSRVMPAARRRSRRWIAVAAAGVVFAAGVGVVGVRLLGGGAPEPSADEPYYATTDRLEGAASVILRGTITGTRDYDRDGTEETESRTRPIGHCSDSEMTIWRRLQSVLPWVFVISTFLDSSITNSHRRQAHSLNFPSDGEAM
jgi:hypothetical protein